MYSHQKYLYFVEKVSSLSHTDDNLRQTQCNFRIHCTQEVGNFGKRCLIHLLPFHPGINFSFDDFHVLYCLSVSCFSSQPKEWIVNLIKHTIDPMSYIGHI
jgi:hypothetical protein